MKSNREVSPEAQGRLRKTAVSGMARVLLLSLALSGGCDGADKKSPKPPKPAPTCETAGQYLRATYIIEPGVTKLLLGTDKEDEKNKIWESIRSEFLGAAVVKRAAVGTKFVFYAEGAHKLSADKPRAISNANKIEQLASAKLGNAQQPGEAGTYASQIDEVTLYYQAPNPSPKPGSCIATDHLKELPIKPESNYVSNNLALKPL